VGEASGVEYTRPVPAACASRRLFRSSRRPDSRLKANAVPTCTPVAFAGQEHFGEVGQHARFRNRTRLPTLVHRCCYIGTSLWLSAGYKVFGPDAARDFREGESVDCPAHVAFAVPVHQPAHKDLVQGRAGDFPELTGLRNGMRQPPVGDAHAHSALNNLGKSKHQSRLSTAAQVHGDTDHGCVVTRAEETATREESSTRVGWAAVNWQPMRVFGIDCGTEITGFGVVENCESGRESRLVCKALGGIRLARNKTLPARLEQVYRELSEAMALWHPDVVAIEEVFYSVNAKSALKLGQVRGVALLSAACQGLAIAEYAPLKIKSSVVGYGLAKKEQVQFMVARLLGLAELPQPADAADALAIAICHIHTAQTLELQGAAR